MTKTKVILIVSCLVVFAAGASLGALLTRSRPTRQDHSWLAAELNLTAEQRDQIRKIWSETMGSVFRNQSERRGAVTQERDQAILSLIPQAQRSRYESIQQEYTRKMDELSQERKRAFEEAVERTKKVLTAEQAVKYDDLIKKQRERGPWGPHGSRHRHSAPTTGPTTGQQPTSRGGE